jgi:hypothetical protein
MTPARRLLPSSGALAALLAAALAPAAGATAGTDFTLSGPPDCFAGLCAEQLTYDTSQMNGPGQVAVDWDTDPAVGFVARTGGPCAPLLPCVFTSPVYTTPGTHTVMLRVTEDADGVAAFGQDVVDVLTQPGTDRPPDKPARTPTRTPATDPEDTAYGLCRDTPPSVRCQPGNGRRTAGGGEKVSHKGWPRITGVFWQVMDSAGRKKTGGAGNDELLGHHGSDVLSGGAGHDVLWGDWDPSNNSTRQRDVLRGGAGNDFIYPSHGTTTIDAGPGKDYIWAFYGKGVIDCGPGRDTVRVRLNGAFKLKNCEGVGHFCQFGADGHGGCLKPGEKRSARATRGRARAGASG